MGWRRAGRNTAFSFLILLPIGGVALGGIGDPIARGRAWWAVRDRPFDAGPASRARPLTTPAGKQNVAGWVGRIGRREGKSRSFRPYCSIAEVDGLLVGQRPLHDWTAPGSFALRDAPGSDALTTFDFELSASEIAPPAAAKAACEGTPYPANAKYDEAVIPMGSQVEVSGCSWKDALTPCRDGADLVTVRSARDRFLAGRSTAIVTELFLIFVTGLTLSFSGWVAAGSRIMLDRRKREKKRKR